MRTPAQILQIILRSVLVLTLVAGGLLLAMAFFLRQNPHALAEHLADTIRSRTGLECSMGLVDVVMLPVPALAVADVQIHSPTMTVAVAYATVRPSFRALLRGEFEPGDITLLRPEISLTLPDLPLLPSGAAPSAPAMALPTSFTLPEMLQNCRIVIQHGRVEILTPQASAPTQLQGGRILRLNDIRTDITPQSPATLDGWISVGSATLWEDSVIKASLDNLQLELEGAVFVLGGLGSQESGRLRVQGRGLIPGVVQISTMDVELEQRHHESAPAGIINATVQGSFPWEEQPIPFHLEAAAKTREKGIFTIEAADLGLGNDRLRLEATLTLPAAGQSPSVQGKILLHRLSLAQWFGFGRILPPGLQHSLHNLSGSLDFLCTLKGLQVPHLEVQVAGTSFAGRGSVESWADPVILIDAKARQLQVEKALPEALGQFPSAPAFGHAPLTPEPGSASPLPGPDINYDIRLAVEKLHYGPLQWGGVEFRCLPQAKGIADLRIASNSVYGGSLEGNLLLTSGTKDRHTAYSIKTRLKNIHTEKALQALTGSKWLGGRLSGTGQWQAEGKSIAVFLASLSGSTSLRLEDGYFDPPTVPGDGDKIAFSRLELSSRNRGQKAPAPPAPKAGPSPWLTFDGEWQGLMHTRDWQASVRMDGPLSFARSGGLPLTFQKVPASVSLEIRKELSGLSQAVKGHASGRFSFHSGSKMLEVEDAHMTAEGLEVQGNIQSNLADLTLKGDVILKSTQVRRLCALLGEALPASLPAGALQKAEIKGQMSYGPGSLSIQNMQAKIDASHVAGSLEGHWKGRPTWKFDLNADSFDLAHYRSPAPANPPPPSTTPWNLKPLQAMDAQGIVRVNAARLFKVQVQNLHVPLRLNKGVLECTNVRGQVYEAPLTGSLRAEVKNGLHLKVGLQAVNIQMLPLSIDQNLGTLLGGRGAFSSNTYGLLRSDADIPAALAGHYSLEILNGYFQSRNGAGKASGGKTTFTLLRGTGNMNQGVLHNKDFIMDGSSLHVKGQGWINFDSRQLDYTAQVRMGNIAEFPVRYFGSLSNPQRNIQAGKALVETLGQLGTDVFGLVGDVLSTPFKFFR